jgi:uroporphyrinogen III methyltransferase/synthase
MAGIPRLPWSPAIGQYTIYFNAFGWQHNRSRCHSSGGWFVQQESDKMREPLVGCRVLVTRAREAADRLAARLGQLGAEVVHHPVIRIAPPADWKPVDATLEHLDRYDWLVFSSVNGVRYLVERCGTRAASLNRLKIAAIGPGTAEELQRYGLKVDLVPAEYRAESLAAALRAEAPQARFLLARASRGREVLHEQLVAGGASVEQVVVYSSTDVETPDPTVAADLAAGRIDWITVTSSAIARSLVRLFGPTLGKSRLASISPLTSATLRELGQRPAAEAVRYTMDGLVEALLAVEQGCK